MLEEAALALASNVPLYVAGGFGGCGRLLARVLDGEQPVELSINYQRTHTKWYADLLAGAPHAGDSPDFEHLLAKLSAGGLAALNNGLDESDNRVLLATADVDELIALTLRGCSDSPAALLAPGRDDARRPLSTRRTRLRNAGYLAPSLKKDYNGRQPRRVACEEEGARDARDALRLQHTP